MLPKDRRRFTEVLSPERVARPTNLKVPSQSERILALVRYEHARAAADREVESFEDSDDFELDDGEQWFSPYEEVFEPQVDPIPASPPAPPAPPPAEPPAE